MLFESASDSVRITSSCEQENNENAVSIITNRKLIFLISTFDFKIFGKYIKVKNKNKFF